MYPKYITVISSAGNVLMFHIVPAIETVTCTYNAANNTTQQRLTQGQFCS
jgi:hypothetical protein